MKIFKVPESTIYSLHYRFCTSLYEYILYMLIFICIFEIVILFREIYLLNTTRPYLIFYLGLFFIIIIPLRDIASFLTIRMFFPVNSKKVFLTSLIYSNTSLLSCFILTLSRKTILFNLLMHLIIFISVFCYYNYKHINELDTNDFFVFVIFILYSEICEYIVTKKFQSVKI